jgi:hypothetical protein
MELPSMGNMPSMPSMGNVMGSSAKANSVPNNNQNVEAPSNASAKANRVPKNNQNVEAPANASAKPNKLPGNINLEKGNKNKNNTSRPGSPTSNASSHATADPAPSSPMNAEEAGFPPNTAINVKGGGRKSRKNRKTRKSSRKNRRYFCRK